MHELRPRAPRAEEVDVAGGLVCPGFEDAHVHPMVGGLERLLRPDAVRHAGGVPRRHRPLLHPSTRTWEWIREGWTLSAFGDRGPLAAGPGPRGRGPAGLPASNDHHDAWVSSRALEIAGVDARTPDPGDGWLLRDEHGRPTGTLHEAAMSLVHRHVVTEPAEGRAALLEAQSFLHSLGITGWQDALLGGYAGSMTPPGPTWRCSRRAC